MESHFTKANLSTWIDKIEKVGMLKVVECTPMGKIKVIGKLRQEEYFKEIGRCSINRYTMQ
jgi:hypothetical protein